MEYMTMKRLNTGLRTNKAPGKRKTQFIN